MNKRQVKKQLQKLCMYFCMNTYLASFDNIDFSGLRLPSLISDYVKEVPVFSNLSKRNIEKQFHKGLIIFYKKRRKYIIWEYKLPLLKSKQLTEHLCNLVIEMYKLRLNILKDYVSETFTDDDCNTIEVMCRGLEMSDKKTVSLIQNIQIQLRIIKI